MGNAGPIRRAHIVAALALVLVLPVPPAASATTLAPATATATAPAPAAGAERWVDGDGRAGPTGCDGRAAAARTISAAIAASGRDDTIRVCPGRYRETLVIAGSGRDGLTIAATEPGAAELLPPPAAAGASAPPADLVRIEDADGVAIRRLRIRVPTGPACVPVETAIHVTGGARDVRVRDTRIETTGTDTLGACGYRTGIRVDGGAEASIVDTVVRDCRRSPENPQP